MPQINCAFTDPNNPHQYDLVYSHRVLLMVGTSLGALQEKVAETYSKKYGVTAKPYQMWLYRPSQRTKLQEVNSSPEWFKRKMDFSNHFRFCQPAEPLGGSTPDEAWSVDAPEELHFIVQFHKTPPSIPHNGL